MCHEGLDVIADVCFALFRLQLTYSSLGAMNGLS